MNCFTQFFSVSPYAIGASGIFWLLLIRYWYNIFFKRRFLYISKYYSIEDFLFLKTDFWGYGNFLSSKTLMLTSLFQSCIVLYLADLFLFKGIDQSLGLAVIGASLTYNYFSYFKKWGYLSALYNQYLNANDKTQSDYIRGSLVSDVILMGYWNHSSFERSVYDVLEGLPALLEEENNYSYADIKTAVEKYCVESYNSRFIYNK